MNLGRCEKGHFYDKEKYSTCPHCAQGAGVDNDLTQAFDNAPGADFNNDLTLTEAAVRNMDSGFPPQGMQAPPVNMNVQPMDATETVPSTFTTTGGGNGKDVGIPMPEEEDSDVTEAFYDGFFGGDKSESPAVQPVQAVPAKSKPSYRVTTPCVGWVVALKGVHTGQDFHLKAGKNFLGRDSKMDICLEGEKSVSRQRHAIIVYEPKQHIYLIQPGESSELVYLNGNVVLNPVKLSAYDIITIGEVDLLFIPLCSEKFNWTTQLQKKN